MRIWLIKACFGFLVATAVYVAIAYEQDWIGEALWYLAFLVGLGICAHLFVVVPILAWRKGHKWGTVFFVVGVYGFFLVMILAGFFHD
jgi:hypothetical protein